MDVTINDVPNIDKALSSDLFFAAESKFGEVPTTKEGLQTIVDSYKDFEVEAGRWASALLDKEYAVRQQLLGGARGWLELRVMARYETIIRKLVSAIEAGKIDGTTLSKNTKAGIAGMCAGYVIDHKPSGKYL